MAKEKSKRQTAVTKNDSAPRQTIHLHSLLRSIAAQPELKIAGAAITVTSLLYRLPSGVLRTPTGQLVDSQRRNLRLELSLELDPGQRVSYRFREANKGDPEIIYAAENKIIEGALPSAVHDKKAGSHKSRITQTKGRLTRSLEHHE